MRELCVALCPWDLKSSDDNLYSNSTFVKAAFLDKWISKIISILLSQSNPKVFLHRNPNNKETSKINTGMGFWVIIKQVKFERKYKRKDLGSQFTVR